MSPLTEQLIKKFGPKPIPHLRGRIVHHNPERLLQAVQTDSREDGKHFIHLIGSTAYLKGAVVGDYVELEYRVLPLGPGGTPMGGWYPVGMWVEVGPGQWEKRR